MNEKKDYSESFYASHAARYAEVAHEFLQSVYIESSHPNLKTDLDLQNRLKELAPGRSGLDAGCGAGARDVYALYRQGYDMWGVDAVPENIDVARQWHPEIAERVQVHNLSNPLPFESESFDFTMCNAVIQHIPPDTVFENVLPELARVIRPDGVLQLMFKNGEGIDTVYDKDYCSDRCFQLYRETKVLDVLNRQQMELIEPEKEKLGGMMHFTDPKSSEHCVMFLRKTDFNNEGGTG